MLKKNTKKQDMKPIEEYDFPQELKQLSEEELSLLSDKIRDFLVEKVSATGGHLASNMGIVELTVALHYVFDSPRDRILWDVGHQSYVHKILTGRAKDFVGLRLTDGLSGFPKRKESPHDVYDAGHSSDSISIALGIAQARDLKKEDYSVVAVIGDGAMTGGVAYEGLNNAGASKTKILIVLNDNQMSISENIGGMSQHLSKLRTGRFYQNFKKKIKKGLNAIPAGQEIAKGLEWVRDTMKYAVLDGDSSMFEGLGLRYYGPVDGHNIPELVQMLESIKEMEEPVLLHVVTTKGKGNTLIEEHAEQYHGVGPFDVSTFEPVGAKKPSYSKVFGNKIAQMAELDDKIVAVSAAMIDGTGLTTFHKRHPERVFDVGIAEQHAVSFASGLALAGMKPFVAVYSTFLQRAYDEILTNVCLQNLPVVFCIDRAGNVGSDGETHNGQFDLSYLLSMPGMKVLAPKDGWELEKMMEYAASCDGPCAIRYPRGDAGDYGKISTDYNINGKSEILRSGTEITLAAVGKMVGKAMDCAEILEREYHLSARVINVRFVKPMDQETMLTAAKETQMVVTLEDNVVENGFGAAVCALIAREGITVPVLNVGWPDAFIEQGDTAELERRYGLDGQGIVQRIVSRLMQIGSESKSDSHLGSKAKFKPDFSSDSKAERERRSFWGRKK